MIRWFTFVFVLILTFITAMPASADPSANEVAAIFASLQDTIMRQTEYWRALLGAVILLLVLVFPGGIVGAIVRFSTRSNFLRRTGAHPESSPGQAFSGKFSKRFGKVPR